MCTCARACACTRVATRAERPSDAAANHPVLLRGLFVTQVSMSCVLLAPRRYFPLAISAAGLVGWLVAVSAGLAARAGHMLMTCGSRAHERLQCMASTIAPADSTAAAQSPAHLLYCPPPTQAMARRHREYDLAARDRNLG